MRTLLTGSLLALSLALVGCPSTTTLGMARTLDHGHLQLAVGSSIAGIATSSQAAQPNGLQLELAGRYGLTDHVELGLKLWAFAALLETKLSLLRSSPRSGFDLAIAPAVGAAFYGVLGSGSPGHYDLYLPLLLGFNLDGHQLVLAPRAIAILTPGSSSSNMFLLGGSVGFAIRVNDWFWIMPELAFQQTVYGPQSPSDPTAFFQAGVGFLIGGYEGTPPP